jgi:ABC-type antimicrobial peptide transport system permease subunit
VRAVQLLAWSELRRRWRSAIALALLVGVLGAIVLAAAAGARRSDSALARFTTFSRSADVSFLTAFQYTPTASEMNAVRHVPDVAAAGVVRFFAAGSKGLPSTDSIAAAVDGVEGNSVERARVVAGRAANPSAIDELDVDEPLAAQAHLRVGSHLDLESFTPAQFKAAAASNGQLPPPAGPRLRLTVVGIVRRPLDLGDDATQGGIFLLTPAFDRAFVNRIGNFGVGLDVRTVHGASDVRSVTAAVQKIFRSSGGATPQGKSDATQGARNAIGVSTLALWILAGVAALAGIVVLAIVLSREISRIGADQVTLRSLGLTRSQLVLTSAPRALVIAAGGGLLAAIGAVALSPLFPVGVARQADPSLGFHVDWVVVGPGIVGVVVVVSAIAFVASYRSTARSALGLSSNARQRPSTIVDTAARAAAPPPVTSGLRMALEPGRGRTAVPVRSALLGVIVGVLGVAAVLVFATNLDQLVATPARYGWEWTFRAAVTNNSSSAQQCNSSVTSLTKVRGVGAIAAVCYDGIQLGGRPVIGWGFTPVRGSISPGIVAGRAPQAADEVALGALTLRELHKHVGDDVQGRGPHGAAEYRIVGEAVFPVLGSPQPLSDGAALTGAGLLRVYDSNAASNRFIVGRFAPASDRAAVERTIAGLPGMSAPGGPILPVEISRVHQINWLPTAIAFLLGALAALAVGHALVTAVRRRGRELALLKTLGFTRRQVHATVAWQATTLGIIGLVVGIPGGVIVGRTLWRVVANGLGVTTATAIPATALLLCIPCALALVNLVAFFPARTAGRTSPAAALRSE